MEYNSTRRPLVMREYGRNIQKMGLHTISIEDREKRSLAAKSIVQIMGQMVPQTREVIDYKNKLWDHLHTITNYELDIDAPYPKPNPQEKTIGARLKYSNKYTIKYRHYGRIVQTMIKKAIEMPEGEEKEAFVVVIANQLKKSYLNWNRDSVNDETIEAQLIELSNGQLKINDISKLSNTQDILRNQKKMRPKTIQNNNQNNKNPNNGPRNNNGGSNNGFNYKNKPKKKI